jgi:hypothetical protein
VIAAEECVKLGVFEEEDFEDLLEHENISDYEMATRISDDEYEKLNKKQKKAYL